MMVYGSVAGETSIIPRIAGIDRFDGGEPVKLISSSGLYDYDIDGFSEIHIAVTNIAGGKLTIKIAEF